MSGIIEQRRRTRKDVQRNLQRVLDAAHQLFAERGQNVTMEEVARRAGVGVGTVYRRFPSKEHLFAAVQEAACTEAHQCVAEVAAAEPDPLRRLRMVVHVHYRRNSEQAALLDFRPEGSAEQVCPSLTEQHQLYASLHHLLQHIIIDGQMQGSMCAGDAQLLAALCLELLHPRVLQHMQQLTGGDPADVAEHVVSFMLSGLRPR